MLSLDFAILVLGFHLKERIIVHRTYKDVHCSIVYYGEELERT